MIKVSRQHIPFGKKRTGKKMKIDSITIHSTSNSRSTAQNERDYLTNPSNTNSTGFHYVVGDDIIIECIPHNEVAYHCGDKRGNHTSIGIEMVETGDRAKVIHNTVRLVERLMGKYNIPTARVFKHRDWDKSQSCPRILNDVDWNRFKVMIDSDMPDYETIAVWGRSAWQVATKLGIVDGSRANDKATRLEVVAMLDRLGLLDFSKWGDGVED